MPSTLTQPVVQPATGEARCPACGGGGMRVFFDVARAPVLCNVLCATREAALAVPSGPIRLAFCPACAMVANIAFDERLMHYGGSYENSLQFSPRFQAYLDALARGLVDRFGLHGKDLIEIGCGQGDFLSLLCQIGSNRGLGFDPSFEPGKTSTVLDPRVTILPEFYSDAQVDRPADLVCCRHVLEHIPEPLAFLRSIRRASGDGRDPLLFFEVPNALYTLERLGIWDIIYEHCSYFTPASLTGLFRRAGFQPLGTEQVYDGQFLTIEARPAAVSLAPDAGPDGGGGEVDAVAGRVVRFAEEYYAKTRLWRERLAAIGDRGQRAVIWGAGSKGVTFLNVLAAGDEVIPFAVDLNPRKHGRFVAGTGQQIVPPEFLRQYCPDVILIMNGIYESEIARACRQMGLDCDLLLAA